MTRPLRVAHLVSHPVHYFAPLYRELSRRPEIDLTVFFYANTASGYDDRDFGQRIAWGGGLLDGYHYEFTGGAARRTPSSRTPRPNVALAWRVARGGYDVLWAHGYAHATAWLALAAARARGSHLLIRDEQTLLHERPWPKRAARDAALRALFSQASALYIGERNREFFRHHGVPDERLFAAPYCVDNGYFQRRAAELAPRRAELRASFGIDGDAPVVLFAGKLIEKKQPLRLVEAFARVRASQPCALLIAGDGPQRAACEALARRVGAPNIRFAGFLPQDELPRAYAAADVFVLPSKLHETWGLVVNEAMNFALPVIVSDKVGCAPDLVRPDENGFVVAHDDTAELAARIATLVRDAGMRRRFGQRSAEIVRAYSIEAAADGIVAACVAGREEAHAWSQHASTARAR